MNDLEQAFRDGYADEMEKLALGGMGSANKAGLLNRLKTYNAQTDKARQKPGHTGLTPDPVKPGKNHLSALSSMAYKQQPARQGS